MTVMTHEPSTAEEARSGIAARLLVPEFWGAVSIVAMWLAVLFDGVFGSDMHFSDSSGNSDTIASVVLVALFALLGTVAVARHAFRGRNAG